jgi:hypothetical protein
MSQLTADQCRRARSAARRAVQHAEQRTDRELGAELEPRPELLKRPAVDPDLAPPAALTGAHNDSAAVSVKIGLGERERFADPQPRAPQHHDHPAQPDSLMVLAGGAHHRDDLLHGRRVRRVASAPVARRTTDVEAGQGRR